MYQSFPNLFTSDLAPLALPFARSAREWYADFGGASRRQNQIIENGARSELLINGDNHATYVSWHPLYGS
jgi:hypothetical protein